MRFTQHYLDCLSQASYLVGDETTGQAVVVDPRRDVEDYLAEAAAAGLTIVGVVNTHFHADFVSGHLELARATGAWIGYGAAARPEFDFRPLVDGERISLGEVTLQILATPGHTPESISVLVFEHPGDRTAYGVLTGDCLFIGDVGRPDLLASAGTTADELGRQLYHSVQHVLMGLPDEVRVFPAHGAGSACGKHLSTERQSTIGQQRRGNYACRPMTEQQFVDVVTEGQPPAPAYFGYNATLNKQRRAIREPEATVPALTDAQAAAELAAGAVVHDARPTVEHARGHLAGALSVPLDGRLAETVGMLLDPTARILVMAPAGAEQQVAMRLARVGYDNVAGYLPDPDDYLARHPEQTRPGSRVTVAQLADARAAADLQLLDVRNDDERTAGVISGARSIPLPQLVARLGELDPARPVVVHCAGGWRSAVAASLLRQRGFGDVSDLLGGYHAWSQHRLDDESA